jgi:hypothetical protein
MSHNTITVRFSGTDYTARVTGDDWQSAALRAIRRAAGRGATIGGWIVDCWEADRDGRPVRHHYRVTVCGRPIRGERMRPILGTATLSV